jgi:hypothetical protein
MVLPVQQPGPAWLAEEGCSISADTPTVTVDALDAALAAVAGSLAKDEQRLAVAVVRR